MPRKKSSQSSDGPSQPAKRPKKESAESEMPVRRSQRTKSQDESVVSSTKLGNAKSASETVKSPVARVSPRRGAGYVMTSPKSKDRTPPKLSIQSEACPLELSVKVTPCDSNTKLEESATRTANSNNSVTTHNTKNVAAPATEVPPQRKRRLKSSDKGSASADKRSKLLQVRETVPRVSLGKLESPINQQPDSLDSEDDAELPPLSPLIPKPDDLLLNRAVIRKSTVNGTGANEENRVSFSIVSYNMLSEVIRKRYNYSYTEERYLDITHRHARIFEELRHLDSDVVCMQEVDDSYYNSTLRPAMRRLGYKGQYHKKILDQPDGLATFYKTNVFSLVSVDKLSYHQLACQDIKKLEHSQEVKDRLISHVEYPAVLLITTLKHKTSSKSVVVGNTHISYTKFKDIDINALQTAYAFKMMVQHSRYGQYPFVLCGDFNTRVTDPAYVIARDGYLDDQSLKTLQALQTVELPGGCNKSLVDLMWCGFQHPGLDVKSAYFEVQGREPESTTKNDMMDVGVDYIWSSCVHTTSVTKVDKIENNLPDKTYPSDHVSLQASCLM